jgi:hypothetical protein
MIGLEWWPQGSPGLCISDTTISWGEDYIWHYCNSTHHNIFDVSFLRYPLQKEDALTLFNWFISACEEPSSSLCYWNGRWKASSCSSLKKEFRDGHTKESLTEQIYLSKSYILLEQKWLCYESTTPKETEGGQLDQAVKCSELPVWCTFMNGV